MSNPKHHGGKTLLERYNLCLLCREAVHAVVKGADINACCTGQPASVLIADTNTLAGGANLEPPPSTAHLTALHFSCQVPLSVHPLPTKKIGMIGSHANQCRIHTTWVAAASGPARCPASYRGFGSPVHPVGIPHPKSGRCGRCSVIACSLS